MDQNVTIKHKAKYQKKKEKKGPRLKDKFRCKRVIGTQPYQAWCNALRGLK